MNKLKVLFLVTEDWYFVSHRLALAIALQSAGYNVGVVTRIDRHEQIIRDAGLQIFPFEISRSGLNPVRELLAIVRLIKLLSREAPDIVHSVAMKPVLYGSIAALLTRVPFRINAIAGMGWLFTSETLRVRMVMSFVRTLFRGVLRSGETIVQNLDDAALLKSLNVPSNSLHIIPGSGVDLARFDVQHVASNHLVVVLPSRLLKDKGVREYVEAARILLSRGFSARFVLVGAPDTGNPSSIPEREIEEWVVEGVVEHWGWVDDMREVFRQADIVCLPSYREGLPKCLIEAAAASRAIVSTDVPGCREIVRDGINGFLVAPKDSRALVVALERLICDRDLRIQMGVRGRCIVEAEYSLELVIQKTLEVYSKFPV